MDFRKFYILVYYWFIAMWIFVWKLLSEKCWIEELHFIEPINMNEIISILLTLAVCYKL